MHAFYAIMPLFPCLPVLFCTCPARLPPPFPPQLTALRARHAHATRHCRVDMTHSTNQLLFCFALFGPRGMLIPAFALFVTVFNSHLLFFRATIIHVGVKTVAWTERLTVILKPIRRSFRWLLTIYSFNNIFYY